jgi:hypothetical protein
MHTYILLNEIRLTCYLQRVWYTFTGTGDTRLLGVSSGADGAFFDVVLTVYSGSCENLLCIEGEDISYRDLDTGVVLDTVEDETYLVLVHGNGLSRGDFDIGMVEISRPENDICEEATMLELGDTTQGETDFAKMEDDVEFLSCGLSQGGNFSAPGVWYWVEGGGYPVQASANAEYDLQLTVFSGSCDSLRCVDGSEGIGDDFLNARVIWNAEEGVSYYIYVHGFSNAVGEFELFYETAIFRG